MNKNYNCKLNNGGIFIKSKLIIVALSLFVLISSLSCVSAVADNQTDFSAQVDVEEETLTDVSTDVGNFNDLNELIDSSGNNLVLNKDYKFNSSTDIDFYGFTINNDNYVVDGQGHSIDGAGQVRIFTFTGSNITLKNLKIMNANGVNGSAACFNSLNMIDNCSFINNSASGQSRGGAVYIGSSVSDCKINASFIDNSAYHGGAIFFNGTTDNCIIDGYFEGNDAERIGGAICFNAASRGNVISAGFNNNRVNNASGGALFFRTLAEGNKFEGVFRRNSAVYGGAIFFYNKANNNKFVSVFDSNVAGLSGGAIVFANTTNKNNFSGSFVNNIALEEVHNNVSGIGGAMTFRDVSSNCLFNCNFVNNTAINDGGAINFRKTPCNITFDCDFTNNTAIYGGAIHLFESLENLNVSGSLFYNNFAGQGGAIFVGSPVSDCKINAAFINNSAYQGGAIFFNGTTDKCIIDGYFGDNNAERIGGAICFNAASRGNVISADFDNNRVNVMSGGALFFRNIAEDNKFEGNFNNNSAVYGGAIFFLNKANNNTFDSNFDSNVGLSSGGAVVFFNTTNKNIFTGSFINNSALGKMSGDMNGIGGAITLRDVSSNCLFNCSFVNNTAAEEGGAINFRQTPINLTFASEFNGNTAKYGGAIHFYGNGTVNNSVFINNSAEDGGAILAHGDLTITNSKFEDNIATIGTNHVSLKDDGSLTLINVVPENLGPLYVIQLKNLIVSNITYGETVKISSEVVDRNNVSLNNGTLYVVINGKTYSANVSNGTATIEIPNLGAGNYNVDVKYLGNDSVADSPVSFTVFKQNVVISAEDKAYVINYGGKYSIVLKDANGNVLAGKNVVFNLNGKDLGSVITDINGVATISLTAKILKEQKAGVKNLVITVDDSNYTASKTVKIAINKEKTKITAKNKVFKSTKKSKKYAATLKNSKGKAIKKVIVTLKVKGKTYKAKTNSKGKAIFNLKKLTKKGTYKAVIKFKGNALYKPATKKVKIAVKK